MEPPPTTWIDALDRPLAERERFKRVYLAMSPGFRFAIAVIRYALTRAEQRRLAGFLCRLERGRITKK